MAKKAIGKMDYMSNIGCVFFAGYCPFCGKHHYLSKAETKLFIEEAECYFTRSKLNFLKVFSLPKPETVEPPEKPKKERLIDLEMFDRRYRELGGSSWLKPEYKLAEIAQHFGFSIEYASRLKKSLQKNIVGSNIEI